MAGDDRLAEPALLRRSESFMAGALLPSWKTYHEVRAAYQDSRVNLLLILVPIAIVAGALAWPPVAVFWLNFFAIIPLAPLIWMSVVELSAVMEQNLGGFLRSTCVNGVEMIVVIIALVRDKIPIVKNSLIGSILSYSLLVLGSIFFFASYGKEKVDFDKTLTSIMSSLMMVVSISLIIPTMVAINMEESKPGQISHDEIIILSHGTAIVLLILFFVYMIFRLRTHKCLFNYGQYDTHTRRQGNDNMVREDPDASLSVWAVCSILIASIVPTCVCTWYLLGSVDGMAKATNMSKEFIGFILIPAVGNAAKCIAIASSSRRTIDLAIRTIMSSVLNNLLFMFPFSILLGWIAGRNMFLNFDQFEATVFFLAIIIMTCLIQYGKTNYFEGAMLIGTYLVIAISFYVRPDPL